MNKRRTRKSTLLLVTVITLMALLMSGCGPKGPPTAAPLTKAPPTEAVPTAAPPTEAPQTEVEETHEPPPAGEEPSDVCPHKGGALKVAFSLDPGDLTPGVVAQWPPALVFEHVYDTLLRLDKDGNLLPGLAVSYGVSPDNKTVTFQLREGVMWHHGREFDAEDVVYTFERLLDPETASPWEPLLNQIAEVEATDKYTVQFTLKEPFAPFLTYVATVWYTAILPRDFTPDHDLNREASGTGPFMLKEYVPDDHVTLVRNPNYWEAGLPCLDSVEFLIMPDPQSQIAALRTGVVDLITVNDPKLLSTVEGVAGTSMIPPAGAVNEAGIGINCAEGPTADVRVRQALSMGMDRQALIDVVLFGYGQVGTKISCGKVPYGYCGDGADLPYHTYDPQGAIDLLTEAGCPDGLDLTIKVSPQLPLTVQTAEVLQEQWAKIGVNLKIEQIADFNQLLDDFIKVNHQLAMIQHVWQPDPDADVYQIYHSESPINLGKFKDLELDALMDQARAEMDVSARIDLYMEVQRLVADQVYMMYPWTKPVNWQFVADYVNSYEAMPSGSFQYFRQVWLNQ